MSAPDRAAVIAAFRAMLDVLEADESLPLPYMDARGIEFYLSVLGDAPRTLASLEAALSGIAGPFAGGIDPDSEIRWLSRGSIGGVPVLIRIPATAVAERRVTGIRTVEDVEWVRLPVPAEDETEETS